MKLLDGKVAIVTGVGPGIGRATALLLAEHGASVAVAARGEEKLKELAAEIEAAGGRALAHPTNIADPDSCDALAQATVDTFGCVDILVQNAFMHPPFVTIEESDPEDWRRSFKVNVIGTLQMCQSVLRHMKDGASIVVTNSMAARNAGPDGGAYSAAKGALLSFVRTLAHEAGPRGIRVNSVLPGYVEGPSLDVYFEWQSQDQGRPPDEIRQDLYQETVLRRLVSPEDVAGAILFLTSDLAHGVTGIALDVNAGHWLP
jgi:NAD(P)-dependent dehydrogenase (short-subunit alcohol dehydrogenase family)